MSESGVRQLLQRRPLRYCRAFVVWFSVFFLAGESLAATYYVSPAGNDTNVGSTTAPFRTIQKAANVVNPGDTVIVRDGTYTDTDGNNSILRPTRGGTSSAWVTFKSEHKWGAVLDGQNQNNTGASYCIIGGSASANYIRIDGFEMKNCDNGTFHNLGEHDIYISNNYIHDMGRRTNNTMYGMTGSYTGSRTYNFTWDSNVFRDIGRLNPQTTPPASESSCATRPDYLFKGVPYGNQVHCYSHDHGLYLKSSYNTIVNNVFEGQFMSGFVAIFFSGSTNHTFINNTIAAGDNLHASGQIVFQWSNKPVTVRNNIFYGDASCAIKTCAGSQGVIENNVFYPTTTERCNQLPEQGIGDFTSSGNIDKNPLFVNPAGYDFHLRKGSPAIDHGAGVAVPSRDIKNTPRPQGNFYDIGAYEFEPPAN